MDDRRGDQLAERLPADRSQQHNTGTFCRRARGRIWRRASTWQPAADLAARLASADHATATWINPAAFTAAPAGTFGNAPRMITELRTPPIINTDLSVIKSLRLGGGKSAQIKIEMLNLFNRVQLPPERP